MGEGDVLVEEKLGGAEGISGWCGRGARGSLRRG